MPISQRDRIGGCLLGLAVGDAAGAPFESMPADAIFSMYGSALRIVRDPPADELFYTDDTQMAISVAECLARHGRIDEDALVDEFVKRFERGRGYGPMAFRLLTVMSDGRDWRTMRKTMFRGEGSLGNGAAMRVGPVGVFFADDLDKVAEQAAISALPTHQHPVGVEGAVLIALSAALASRDGPIDRGAFVETLMLYAKQESFRYQLERVAQMTPDDMVGPLGHGVRADESVVSAIACFLNQPDSYEKTIAEAIMLGGDTDTLAAMAGTISGAHLGIAAVPKKLIGMLENGKEGRAYLLELARRLADRALGQQ